MTMMNEYHSTFTSYEILIQNVIKFSMVPHDNNRSKMTLLATRDLNMDREGMKTYIVLTEIIKLTPYFCDSPLIKKGYYLFIFLILFS
jgi:hypothetical protein